MVREIYYPHFQMIQNATSPCFSTLNINFHEKVSALKRYLKGKKLWKVGENYLNSYIFRFSWKLSLLTQIFFMFIVRKGKQ